MLLELLMTRHCTILGLPLQAGTGRGGCLMGPDAFRTAGLGDVVTSQGFGLSDLGNLPFPTDPPFPFTNFPGPGHQEEPRCPLFPAKKNNPRLQRNDLSGT